MILRLVLFAAEVYLGLCQDQYHSFGPYNKAVVPSYPYSYSTFPNYYSPYIGIPSTRHPYDLFGSYAYPPYPPYYGAAKQTFYHPHMQLPRAHLYGKESASTSAHTAQQIPLPFVQANAFVPQQIPSPFLFTQIAAPATIPFNPTSVGSNSNISNLTDETNGTLMTTPPTNGSGPVLMGMKPQSIVNYTNNKVNQNSAAFPESPLNQAFYPSGYGPWNTFVLTGTPYSSAATGNYTGMVWPMQPIPVTNYLPMINPLQPLPVINHPPVINSNPSQTPSMNPIYSTDSPSTTPLQPDDGSGPPTIINSSGDAGSDINSLPPQVKEFMAMIPDILSMPGSPTFGQNQQSMMGRNSITHHHLARTLPKAKSSSWLRKNYMPSRSYNNDY